MLALLNDSHITLRDTVTPRRFSSGAISRARTGEFSLTIHRRRLPR